MGYLSKLNPRCVRKPRRKHPASATGITKRGKPFVKSISKRRKTATVKRSIQVDAIPIRVNPTIQVEPTPVSVNPTIEVNPAPVPVNPTIQVNPAPVNVNPILTIAPFSRVCRTLRSTSTFSNPEVITVPGGIDTFGEADPYPSNIIVSGLTGTISKVTVTLLNITHTSSNDIDVLLVAPDGITNTVLMSDAGSTSMINVTLTFDDNAAESLPALGLILSGIYKPTNNLGDIDDFFPPPAPPASPVVALSNFIGMNPNGTWSLYVSDDTITNTGSIAGGWSLAISTDVEECIYNPL